MITRKRPADWHRILFMVLTAFVICIQLQSPISQYVYSRTANRTVTIQTPEVFGGHAYSQQRPVIIVDGFAYNGVSAQNYPHAVTFSELKASVVNNRDFKFIPAASSPYHVDCFVSQSKNASISFSLPYVPESSISFLDTEAGDYPIVTLGNQSEDYWFNEKTKGKVETAEIYPFCHEVPAYLTLYGRFLAAYAAVFLGILLGIAILLEALRRCRGFFQVTVTRRGQRIVFWAFFGILAVSAVCYYALHAGEYDKLFQPGSQADAYYYMTPQIYDESGRFSLSYFAKHTLFQHRGYYQLLLWAFFSLVGGWFHAAPVYLHLLAVCLLVSYTLAYAIPMISESLFEKPAPLAAVIVTGPLFALYWYWYLFYYLSDLYAGCLAVIAGAYFLQMRRSRRIRDAVLAGCALSVSINFRSSYAIYLYAFLLWLAVCAVRAAVRKGRSRRVGGNKAVPLFTREAAAVYGTFLAAVVILGLPQLGISALAGSPALFPHDTLWRYDYTNRISQTLTEDSFQIGTDSYYFMAKAGLDAQMQSFANLYYDKLLVMRDIVLMCFDKPGTFLEWLLKKLLAGLTTFTQDVYRGGVPPFILALSEKMSLFLQGTALFGLFSKKARSAVPKRFRLFASLVFLLSALLPALLHIELRYFFTANLLLIFIAAYAALPCAVRRKEAGEALFGRDYCFWILFYMLAADTAWATIQANFI